MQRIALNSRRSRTSCSLIALATVMVVGASPAAAQSFAGTGSFTFGTGSINTSLNTTSISVNTPSAVIDWTPTDNITNTGVPIVFQPAGTFANFSGAGNYAVLNRINVADFSRVIQLNGTIQNVASGALTGTGSIYFYSPSGFLLGGSSVINLPSVVFSALPINVDGSGNFISGSLPNRSVTFGQAPNPNATISTAAGSQITANLAGSYVAMVAPRIVHNGNITVNGSAALVAAEAATINFSTDGLFDIQVTVGTTSSDGLNIHGDIAGPTPTGSSDKQGIYLVAVPKNDALTMVIGNGADLGFTLANTAVDDNGVIVLSAGHDIVDGAIGARSAGHGANAAGNFWFTGAHATNNLFGEATGTADLYSVIGSLTTTFDNDVSVHAGQYVRMGVSGVGTSLTVGGNVFLSGRKIGTAGQSVSGGEASIYAWNDGDVFIDGSVTLRADATGGDSSSGTAGSGTGGLVQLNATSGGLIDIDGSVSIDASGSGGHATAAGVNGGAGTGGTVWVYADGLGSSLDIGQSLFAQAVGDGNNGSGLSCPSCNGSGGLGTGGTVSLYSNASASVNIGSYATLDTDGLGGWARGPGVGGTGIGGLSRAYVGNNATLTINGDLTLWSTGFGGHNYTGDGGDGIGGNARMTANAGSTGGGLLTVTGNFEADADGIGGDSFGIGAAGDGIGGSAYMFSTAHHYVINGRADIHAAGTGGNSNSGAGGDGFGGTAEIISAGSEVDITGTVSLDSPGYGGSGEIGGDAFGGEVNIISENDISLLGNVFAFAEAEGGPGGSGNGGYGEGGIVNITADGGNLSIGSLIAVSYGEGGDAGNVGTASGDGQGGSIFINALNGGDLSITNDLDAIAEAYAGRTSDGVDGSGFGGYVELLASGTGSQITVGGNASLNAVAWGQYSGCFGCGGPGAIAGDAFGGSIYVGADGADISIGGNLLAETKGEGGEFDVSGGTAGDGFGGDILIEALAQGNLTVTGSLNADARGVGGDTEGLGIIGGSGFGGSIELNAVGTNASFSVGGTTNLNANGEASSGGECISCGGIGGDGYGGEIYVSSSGSGASLLIGGLSASAEGIGGTGVDADGGYGEGGLIQGYATNGGVLTATGSLLFSADGFGGGRVDGDNGDNSNAIAGDGAGGFVELFTFGSGSPDLNLLASVDIHADGYGGNTDDQGALTLAGNGTGGIAWIDAQTGTIDITGNAIATATGHGGNAAFGTGGSGTGRNAEIDAIGGTVTIGGNAHVSTNGVGGNGVIGGEGIGGGQLFEDGTGENGAHIFAQNGTISITGAATVQSMAQGGDGSSGGDGGDAAGGWATIHAANSNSGPSNITIGSAFVSASATGGAGGQGTSGNQGGDGGDGGDATGGDVSVLANAGNGHVTVTGSVNASSTATGGGGGDGGNGDSLSGGNGGAGGNAEGGGATVGTASGNGQAAGANLGTGSYGSIIANTSAWGGNGGAGNFGTPDGNGGAGGEGNGGYSLLLVRGSQVTVSGATSLISNGTGGDGGFGGGEFGLRGNGGNGLAGELGVVATSRYLFPDQEGTLTTGAITGTATGTGGLGAANGLGIVNGGSIVQVDRSTATLASLNFTITGDVVDPGADESRIVITNGSVGVAGQFGFATDGDLSLYLDNGSLDAGSLYLSAGDFVVDSVFGDTYSNLGTVTAGSASIYTGNNFIATADFDINSSFFLYAPGYIDAHNFDVDGFFWMRANSGDVLVENLTASGYIDASAFDDFTADDVASGDWLQLSADNGLLTTGELTADTFIDFFAGETADLGNMLAGTDITGETDGDMLLSDIDAGGAVNLDSMGLIDAGTIVAGFFRADAGTTFDSANITSDSDIRIGAGGNVTVSDLTAGTSSIGSSKAVRIDTDGSVLVGNILAAGGIDITAAGSVTGGNVTTGDGFFTDADGAIVFQNISAGLVNPQVPSEPFSVGLDSATSISVGNVDATQGIGFVTSGTLTTGNLTTDAEVLGLAHGNMQIGNIDAGGRVQLADSSMFTNAGGTIGGQDDDDADLEAIFAASLVATGGSITVGDVVAGSFRAAPGTFFSSGDVTTDGLLEIDAGTNITGNDFIAGDIFSDATIEILAGGNIDLGDVTSGGSIGLGADGSITTDDLFAYGSITVDAGGAVDLGNVTTQFPPLLLLSEDNISIQSHSLGPSIEIYSDTSVDTGNIYSAEDVIIGSGGSITTGWVFAQGFVDMGADVDIGTGYIDAGEYIDLFADDDMSTGNLLAGLDINLEAGDDIAILDAEAGTEFDFDAGGDITGGDIVAGINIGGEGAGGSVTFGDLTAGFGEGTPDGTFSIGFAAAGPISVGNVNGALRVGFATLGNLTTGNIQAGDDFLAMVSGNITAGSITTGEGDRVYLAHSSMCVTGGGCSEADTEFNPEIVFALDPVPTGGSITINGAVTTGEFDAAAGTGLTTQAITASGDIHARAGGMATVNGIWSSGDDIDLASNDIDITASGGIHADDGLGLFSTNATQALIGDGLAGTGYALSNAEFGRISGYDVGIGGRGDASAAIDMLIGDLTVTGPLAGSTVEGAEGILAFAVGNIDSETVSGVIRVNGDIAATGFGSGNAIEFYATRFELDAATGSVSIFSSGNTLGGELGLYAERVHVADATILGQLATNPTYTGYQEDLNEAAAVQRPEGVLRADTLWIESGNLHGVLIQNTGTAATPAGFLVREAYVNEDIDSPAGSINLVVNGQVVTEGGTLTGIAARDALVAPEDDVSEATANSTINGCPLKGECIIRPPEPPPAANVVDNQIDLITSNPLGDSEFGNEPEIDDGEEGDEGATNPISPPQPLFDTRPLVPASDINDPVSGTGNPALVGGNECEEDEDAQCGTEKGGGE